MIRNGGGGANGPQYDEIPYGDVPPTEPQSQMQNGHSGKGDLPNVPVEYAQLPNLPQRQGIKQRHGDDPIGGGRTGGGGDICNFFPIEECALHTHDCDRITCDL